MLNFNYGQSIQLEIGGKKEGSEREDEIAILEKWIVHYGS